MAALVTVAVEEPAGGSRDSPESSVGLPAQISRKRWHGKFLAALRRSPDVTRACRCAGVSRTKAYRVRQQDAAFAEAWQEALDASLDELEATAFKRAKEGDSQLISWLLRCHRPSVYRETQRTEHAILGKLVFVLPEKESAEP